VQLPKLIDSSKLRSEVQRILTKGRNSKRAPASAADVKDAGDERLAVLLSWCQAVCGSYGLTVLNFRTSFADARGMCLLVRASAISYAATATCRCPAVTSNKCLVLLHMTAELFVQPTKLHLHFMHPPHCVQAADNQLACRDSACLLYLAVYMMKLLKLQTAEFWTTSKPQHDKLVGKSAFSVCLSV